MSQPPYSFPPPFDPTTSLLSGVATATLQANLAAAQQAYMELSAGGKIVKASYTQGDGVKTVEYTPANMGALAGMIQLLQSQLGLVQRPRRPISFAYR